MFGSLLTGALPRSSFASLKALGYQSPNEKLNIAGIGAGGQPLSDMRQCQGENIVALADVEVSAVIAPTGSRRWWSGWRKESRPAQSKARAWKKARLSERARSASIPKSPVTTVKATSTRRRISPVRADRRVCAMRQMSAEKTK